ncbi:energy transducer TonB [Natronospira bacteriovora]|uniref:Protein TonB n=1 Tax=Natronospira bacteriovora TaxID=3069753 RepID=A0ABU0W676_9GAMM|nr:energy transducer TonB [Natronospira sp. AB-CW4]MDQ2069467.1 energy transducer TonB [Natronospira sp. AB-CW4]
MIRFIVALLGGAVVAVLLFFAMQRMIMTDEDGAPSLDRGERIDFIRVERDERVRERERRPPEEPQEPDQPPPPPEMQIQQDQPPQTQLDFDMPRLDIPMGMEGGAFIGRGGQAQGSGDGDVIPIVRVEPQWPREALVQGIEGWVRIEFTIREDGSVANPRVIESEPRRVFDRAALRAIQRWRFRPRIVDGRPVERQATQTIEFNLEDAQ